MYGNRKKLRNLRRQVDQAREDLIATQSRYKQKQIDLGSLSAVQNELKSREWALQKFESNLLIRASQIKGIDIPRKPGWWDDDSEEYLGLGMPEAELDKSVSEWLTETGIYGTKKLFKEERRKTFEWWYMKVVIPTLQALVPIIALFLVYFSRR